MTAILEPQCRPMLIGSQPLNDHEAATRLVLTHVPEIPNWVQLPVFPQEGMVSQYVEGMPGLTEGDGRIFVNTADPAFDDQMVTFFEAYLAATENGDASTMNNFALTPGIAKGFYALTEALGRPPADIFAVKGQTTGPFTFCTSLTDQDRRAVFYNDTLRDAAVKLIALKAAWQVQVLSRFNVPVIIFIDEPSLAGFGSSEYISISKEDIAACLQEVIDAVHNQGGLAGVHVCANTDWSLLLDGNVDIVNFDAYGYLDKFILYGDQIKRFMQRGGCLAWGIVPTSPADAVASASLDNLWDRWRHGLSHMAALGVDAEDVKKQSFITPSCGTGSLPPALSQKVLELTQALSQKIRTV